MQTLTAATLAALVLGLGGFVYDTAVAQKPAACAPVEVSIYFEKDSANLSPAATVLVERMAAEARACGAAGLLVAEAPDGKLEQKRADALHALFASAGVDVTISRPSLALDQHPMAARSASLRLVVAEPAVG